MTLNTYYETEKLKEAIGSGRHREMIGGLWDEVGALQAEVLKQHGLLPSHVLLDVGCGALRGGVHFVKYLEPGNYFGLDLSPDLIEAGYRHEIMPLGLADRLPRTNLTAQPDFDFSVFGRRFDYAVAVSVFTHLPLDLVRVCLERLAAVMKEGGVFLATFFVADENLPTSIAITRQPGGIVTRGGSDPYHHRLSDYEHITRGLPWDVSYAGDFGHPRGQHLLKFTRRNGAAGTGQGGIQSPAAENPAALKAGDAHYRAYVGPPGRYDLMAASQFSLLFHLGLREHHKVLDFGCGSLRLGRLLIPFLQPGHYYGIEPNRWLIDEGLSRELGLSSWQVKQPNFAFNSDFNCEVFGERFDFIIAQSIVTHTESTVSLLTSAGTALAEGGLLAFSYIKGEPQAKLPADGWYYPGCVAYPEAWISETLSAAKLFSLPIPWHHPAASWHLASNSEGVLPTPAELTRLDGRAAENKQDQNDSDSEKASSNRRPLQPGKTIFVVGCHRSGTSALSRSLSLLGWKLPHLLIPPGPSNVLGHWEPRAVVSFNDDVLHACGSSWEDPRPATLSEIDSRLKQQLVNRACTIAESDFPPGHGYVIKDPRSSRVLPIWRESYKKQRSEFSVVLIYRAPGAVCESFRKRDGFDQRHAELLWLAYTLEAEQASRGLPRSFISYEQLTGDPRNTLMRALQQAEADPTGISETAWLEVESFLEQPTVSNRELSPQSELMSMTLNAFACTDEQQRTLMFDAIRSQWLAFWQAEEHQRQAETWSRRPDIHLLKARRFIDNGEASLASGELAAAAGIARGYPGRWQKLHLRLARLMLEAGMLAEAASHADLATMHSETRSMGYVTRGQVALRQNELAVALKNFSDAIASDGANMHAFHAMGSFILLKKRQPAEALPFLETALVLDPDNARLPKLIAQCKATIAENGAAE